MPAEQQKLRAEPAINSMLDASTAELDQLQLDLARKALQKGERGHRRVAEKLDGDGAALPDDAQ